MDDAAMEDAARLAAEHRALRARIAATDEVLRVIAAGPADPQPIYALIARHVRQLAGASTASILEYDGTLLHRTADEGYTPEVLAALRAGFPRPPGPDFVPGRAVLTGDIVNVADLSTEPGVFGPARGMGARSYLGIPLRHEGRVVGVLGIGRADIGSFDAEAVELARSFAEQAVIAMFNARLIKEQREALARQTATAELLRAINASPGELDPVFATILEKAHALCGAAVGALFLLEDGLFRAVATKGYPAEVEAALRQPRPPGGRTRRLLDGARFQQSIDIRDDAVPGGLDALVATFGVRTSLLVPLREEDRLIGWITANRLESRPYAEAEIALLESFAAQAVIAMRNASLLREQREALERQTATAEILQVINANPGNLDPVFDVILEKAHALCGAAIGTFWLRDGEMIRAVATRGYGEHTVALLREWRRPEPVQQRMFDGEPYVHIHDLQAEPTPGAGPVNQVTRAAGIRTVLRIPLRGEAGVIGFITANRLEVKPYAEAEITLLQSFAAQAVIAMDNARLLEELRESLEYQGAISGLLRIVSSSIGELAPVFEGILERAHVLCGAEQGSLQLWDGERMRAVAVRGQPEDVKAEQRAGYAPHPSDRLAGIDHIPDVRKAIEAGQASPMLRQVAERTGLRTLLRVPLLKEGRVLGRIVCGRRQVRPFDAKHIDLLQTFADQAVLAIENARLVEDLRARTAELAARNDAYGEQVTHQSATIDVLKAMSASPADPQPVFALIARRAREICEGDSVTLFQYDGSMVHLRHIEDPATGDDASALGIRRAYPMAPSRATTSGLAILDRRILHMPDMQAEQDLLPALKARGHRSHLAVPLLRGETAVGAIMLNARRPGGFSDRQVDLMTTFAEQAVIAIDSAETYRALQERTAELAARNSDFAERIEHQAATIDVLETMSAHPGDPQPVFELIVERARSVCNVPSAALCIFDGELIHLRAVNGIPQVTGSRGDFGPYRDLFPMVPSDRTLLSRSIFHSTIVHCRNVQAEPGLAPEVYAIGHGSSLSVPMLRDGRAIGTVTLSSLETGGFSDSQVELLRTFAEQAVIAVTSAETYRALQERTAELSTQNAHQGATIDVLKVMSASNADTQPVFDIILRRATELCGSLFGIFLEYDGTLMHYRTHVGFTEEQLHAYRAAFPMRPDTTTLAGRAILERRLRLVPDTLSVPGLADAVHRLGHRTGLVVPLLRDGEPIGALSIGHRDVDAFSAAQVELLQTFAEQAVIAIGSVATFKQLQQRTEELARSVSELQALEEVGRAVNASLELDTVLKTIIARSVTLARADEGTIYEYDAEAGVFVPKAAEGMTEERVAALRFRRVRLGETHLGRAAAERRVVHVPDMQQDPTLAGDATGILAGIHAVLAVPLLREGKVLGGLVIRRRRRGAFEPGTVALLQTFAAQCVLAIENARLFEEARRAGAAAEAALTDLRRTQDRLVQTEKLASLGQLTAGIAHEIKNPLNFVNNFADLSNEMLAELQEAIAPEHLALDARLREEIEELTGTLRGNLEKIAQHGRRADSIVKNMLMHSRSGASEHRPVDLNALAEEALNLAYHGARAARPDFHIALETAFDPAAGQVDLFAQEFTRVLLNLIGNGIYAARQRAERGGEPGFAPTLRLATRDLGDAVEIRVHDNGTGMSDAVRARIFEPFFTTKPAGEGTGLGLSLSHDIVVKQHGGTIAVQSQPDRYTEFVIVLPRLLQTGATGAA